MIWWQWIIGAIEFVAAWYFTTGLIDYLKHREPRTELTEHQRWIAEQDAKTTLSNDWPIKQCKDCRQEARRAIRCHDGWRCRECLDKLPREQGTMVTGEDGRDYRTSPTLHIPDNWRETMKRKEALYFDPTWQPAAQRKGLDYGWWPDT